MSVPINLDWGQFKTFVAQSVLKIDYAPVGTDYFLFSSNGSVMLSAFITDPTDVAEFETLYKPFAFEVSIPPGDGGPATLVDQGTTPWVCSFSSSPPGAATAAKQDPGNSSLASIDTKTPTQGQALMAASSPVVIASNQSALPASQNGSWVVGSAQVGSWVVSISGGVSVTGTVAATQSGSWTVAATQSGSWSVASTQSGVWTVGISGTVPISAASLPLPSGASTEATLSAINAKVPSLGQAAMAASTPVVIASNQSSFAVAATQSGVWTVAVSGTVPISASSLPLPTGASTEATLSTRNAEATQLLVKAKTDNLDVLLSTRATEITLSAINTKTPSIGQSAMAASSPVVIASDQSVFSVSIGSSTGKTVIGKTGTLVTTAVTADQVILTYTVTGGKTLYLEGFDWQVARTTLDSTNDEFGNISLETPSGAKIQTWNARGAGKDSFNRSITEPLPIAAGTVIRFVVTPTVTNSTTWVANLLGWEK